MYSTNAYNAYKKNSINYAPKEQLLVMLVEGAVKYAKIGRQAIIDKDVKKAHKSLTRVQDIYYELMATLDVRQAGEWGQNLMSIYEFIVRRIGEANIKKDVSIVDEVLPLIEDIKSMWKEAEKLSRVQK